MQVRGFQDTIEWYNQNAAQYADTSIVADSIHDEEQRTYFLTLLPKHAKILDAGCGSGRDTHSFASHGFEVTGIDISHGLIAEARKRFPHCTFVEGDLRALPYEDETFDGVWAHASLLHLETIEDVRKVLHELYRVLKKDGVAHVLVKAQLTEKKTAVVSDRYSNHDRFFQYFSTDEVRTLLTETGFTVLELTQYNESDRNPKGRAEVEWIVTFSRK